MKAPGKSHRQGITLFEAFEKFRTDELAEQWFIETRWPNGVACPKCGSINVQERKSRKPQPFRCRDYRKDFSVKTDWIMHSSNVPLRKWAMACFLMSTSLKGVSGMKLHRDLGVSQKTAWHMLHRIREAWGATAETAFAGPVEADETYVGGKELNKHASKRKRQGGGTAGESMTVQGRRLPDGMVYVGSKLRGVSQYVETEPALIDPLLLVDDRFPDIDGHDMSYWPSYDDITPASRAACCSTRAAMMSPFQRRSPWSLK